VNTVLVNYVSYFAAQVRGALADLSTEVVDDLTEGLEADLIDAMSEDPKAKSAEDLTLNDLIERFGKPTDYASELRGAAGLETGPIVENQPVRRTVKRSRVVKPSRTVKLNPLVKRNLIAAKRA